MRVEKSLNVCQKAMEIWSNVINLVATEAIAQRCSIKKMLLEISQNSQENTCARVSFLIKLQARDSGTSVFLWILQNF